MKKVAKIEVVLRGEKGYYWDSELLRQFVIPAYEAFAEPFPSLPNRTMAVSMSTATIMCGKRDGYQNFHTFQRAFEALDEASCEGQWPGVFYMEAGYFKAVPYVGDRTFEVRWNEADHSATVICDYERRPSLRAAEAARHWAEAHDGTITYIEVKNDVILDQTMVASEEEKGAGD